MPVGEQSNSQGLEEEERAVGEGSGHVARWKQKEKRRILN